jgi:hypothetical protein
VAARSPLQDIIRETDRLSKAFTTPAQLGALGDSARSPLAGIFRHNQELVRNITGTHAGIAALGVAARSPLQDIIRETDRLSKAFTTPAQLGALGGSVRSRFFADIANQSSVSFEDVFERIASRDYAQQAAANSSVSEREFDIYLLVQSIASRIEISTLRFDPVAARRFVVESVRACVFLELMVIFLHHPELMSWVGALVGYSAWQVATRSAQLAGQLWDRIYGGR